MKTMFSKLLIVTLAVSTLSAHAEGKSTSRKKAAIVAAVVAGTAAVAGLAYWKWDVVKTFVPFIGTVSATAAKDLADTQAAEHLADKQAEYKKLSFWKKLTNSSPISEQEVAIKSAKMKASQAARNAKYANNDDEKALNEKEAAKHTAEANEIEKTVKAAKEIIAPKAAKDTSASTPWYQTLASSVV